MINRYTDSDSFAETIYRICHDINDKPKCKICGNTVRLKSLKEGFDDFLTKPIDVDELKRILARFLGVKCKK